MKYKYLSLFFTEFCSNEELVGELMLTIASLTVRNEYCTVVESAGGLKFTLEALVS